MLMGHRWGSTFLSFSVFFSPISRPPFLFSLSWTGDCSFISSHSACEGFYPPPENSRAVPFLPLPPPVSTQPTIWSPNESSYFQFLAGLNLYLSPPSADFAPKHRGHQDLRHILGEDVPPPPHCPLLSHHSEVKPLGAPDFTWQTPPLSAAYCSRSYLAR